MSTEDNRKINLDLTPEEALSGHVISSEEDYKALQAKIRSMANVQYPFVDVWNCQARMAWMVFSESGHSSRSERFSEDEQARIGITEDMLYQAIEEAGGAINRSGHYPITQEIRAKLEKAMNCI